MLAHNDSGQIVPSADFDYAAVDEALSRAEARREIPRPPADHFPRANLEKLGSELAAAVFGPEQLDAIRQVLEWIWEGGANNREGLLDRSRIACWHFIPEVEEAYNLTELAGEDRKAKQSLDRQNRKFKDRFPFIFGQHQRPGQTSKFCVVPSRIMAAALAEKFAAANSSA